MSPKTVKRYANRKLYDTERSCYVTLDDIAAMIKAGDEVRVVDNKSGEDLTSVTLAQIIFEAEKKNNFMPLDLLRDLIRNGGGTISDFARQKVDRVQAAALDIKESAKETAQKFKVEVEGKIERLTHRKPDGDDTLVEDSTLGAPRVPERLHELVTNSQRAIDELQKNVEERLKGSVGTVSRYATLGRDMQDIRERLASLEERLGKL
jgi:polyhydroxyalkanoate synthesis repressor PhaR